MPCRRIPLSENSDCYIERMEVYIFRHVAFEGPGAILPYLESKGFHIHFVNLYADGAIPDSANVDFAVLMGGPMSVLDEKKYPCFVREKRFCREMVALDKPMLGICLGAQMIANSLGAQIRKNPEKEIGWFPVTFKTGETLNVFHWHGETFDIPESALPIARSEACKNQGFRLGRTFGLQFHLETTEETMRDILENGKGELSEALLSRGRFVQSESRILAEGNSAIPRANAALVKLLDKIIEDFHG